MVNRGSWLVSQVVSWLVSQMVSWLVSQVVSWLVSQMVALVQLNYFYVILISGKAKEEEKPPAGILNIL